MRTGISLTVTPAIRRHLKAVAANRNSPQKHVWRGYFAKLSKQRLKRGVFRSVVDLQEAINRYLAETNQAPKPFTWTADPDKIIAAVKRGHQVLDSIH